MSTEIWFTSISYVGLLRMAWFHLLILEVALFPDGTCLLMHWPCPLGFNKPWQANMKCSMPSSLSSQRIHIWGMRLLVCFTLLLCRLFLPTNSLVPTAISQLGRDIIGSPSCLFLLRWGPFFIVDLSTVLLPSCFFRLREMILQMHYFYVGFG